MKRKYILYLLLAFLIVSCTITRKKENELMKRIAECIDSTCFYEDIVAVYKSSYDYGDYDLYSIKGFFGIIEGEKYPDRIEKINDKYVFFFTGNEELPMDEVHEIYDVYWDYERMTNTAYYFVQCKKTNKNELVKVVNQDIMPYEIPELRNFSCEKHILIVPDSIELIAETYYVDAHKEYIVHNEVIELFPENIDICFSVYNRTNKQLFFKQANDSLGYFAVVNNMDTLFFIKKEMPLHDWMIDDPTYEVYPDKKYRFFIRSEKNTSFFDNIDKEHYHQSLNSLIRDSLFYFPNAELYKERACEECIYLSEKTKIIVPDDMMYYFYVTSDSLYTYFNDGYVDIRGKDNINDIHR